MHVDDTISLSRIARTGNRRAGPLLAGLACLAALCAWLWPGTARASWLIDQARLHASAHGSLGCAGCHGDIVPGAGHPDPADVTKPLAAFFRADQCLGCHADVGGDLEKGVHGGKPLEAGRDYGLCIGCHDPHTQLASKLPAGFDPAKPVTAQCGACHEKRRELPAPAKDDAACLSCHRQMAPGEPGRREAVDTLCLGCHGAKAAQGAPAVPAGLDMPVLNKAAQAAATHKTLSCLDCHVDGARFPHDRQQRAACATCHARHDEKTIHDAHQSVTCEACHLSGTTPVKDAATGTIVARRDKAPAPLAVHAMTLPAGEASCRRCHVPGNALGAAAMVLPAKGVICLPCHAATFSVADTTSRLSLLVFAGGMAVLAAFWFSGAGLGARSETGHGGDSTGAGHGGHGARSIDWARLGDTILYDIFLQRRLYRQSRSRWAIHALIFYPFVLRFLWGLAGLLGSLWAPRAEWPWMLLDKNNPVGALVFDASGLALLAGLFLAGVSWRRRRDGEAPVTGLPGRDWPALVLLGALVLVGFVLEGMRIAMTGWPAGSGWAFLGYALSRAFAADPAGLTGPYGYVWYAHAILTGLVVAYLPASQLRHALTAPLALLARALGKEQ